jgi:multidrug efflux pump subunit AcrB
MIILVGSVTLYSMQKETFPQVDFDVVVVRVNYPGSSSEDVEKLITIPVERKIKEVEGIKTLNGLSAEGASIMFMEVDPDYNLKEVVEDIKTAVDGVEDLPDDAKPPIVTSANNKTRGIIKVVLTSDSYDDLRITSKDLRDELEREIKDISFINLKGYRADEIRVAVSPEKLNKFEVTLGEMGKTIRERNLNLSAGKIETEEGDIFIRTVGEFETPQDVENVVIRSNSSGQNVTISDVASVTMAPQKDTVLLRSNSERAIFLDIKVKGSADAITSTKLLKTKVESFFKNKKYQNVKYKYADDYSYFVKRRLNILKNSGIMGLVLVFFCLLLFLNLSTSVVTSLGAPIAFMVAFIVMSFMGVTINLISMFALILVLGMLVDDSIIVAEQFYQRLEKGEDPKEAAAKAAMETIKPVTATILTTMVAFGSLFFMGGIMGKFLWPVPAVVIICLVASWFECFFILPSHLADFCRLKVTHQKRRWYDKLTDHYAKWLSFFLDGWKGRMPIVTIVFFGTLFILTIGVAKNMRFELFPGDDVRTVFLQLKGKVGDPLLKTDNAMKKLEEIVSREMRKEELLQFSTEVGRLLGEQQNSKTGNHYGSIVLYLTPPDERERSTDDILTLLTKKAKLAVSTDYTILTKKQQGGPPRGKPIEIELLGDSIAELKEVSLKVREVLKLQKGVTTTEVDFEEGNDQIIVKVNEAEAKRLGLSTSQIALELRQGFAADTVTEIRKSDEDIDIKIVLDDIAKGKKETLGLLHIVNNQGRRIPLSKVVSFESNPGAFIIRRLDRKRIFSVSGQINKEATSAREIVAEMKKVLPPLMKKYPEIKANYGGENKNTQESMAGLLKSFGIAMFAIFFILVMMFGSLGQPFVVMMAIPLGMIGVIYTFLFFNQSLGFMALMGVVALIGVVVNDSIVLVSFINQKISENKGSLTESILEASISRFRPVVLTTVTTVAGLLPIAHMPGGDPFLKPMALAFAWGLLFASAITLLFIPSNYLVYHKLVVWISNKRGKIKSVSGTKRSQESTASGA